MQLKCLVKTFLVILFLYSFDTSGALVQDTDHDSFVDVSTQLEWMDFGKNNSMSYNFVVSQLSEGGLFEGWRLPSKSEAFQLWVNAFLNVGAEFESPDDFGPGEGLVIDSTQSSRQTVLDPIFNAMGYNYSYEESVFFGVTLSGNGLFVDQDIAYIFSINNSSTNNYDATTVRRTGLYNNLALDTPFESRSTLLVRDYAQVDEPQAVFIIILGGLLLIARKVRRNGNSRLF
jgi:hypothetical protein